MSVLFYEASVIYQFPCDSPTTEYQPPAVVTWQARTGAADGGAHMVNMADVEKTKSDAADLLYSDDVKKDSHGKMDNADVGNDHHVVSIHKVFKCGTK